MEEIDKLRGDISAKINKRNCSHIAKIELQELSDCYIETKIIEYKKNIISKLDLMACIENIRNIVWKEVIENSSGNVKKRR